MKKYFILLTILCGSFNSFAQHANFSLGFKAGAAYSGISNIPTMFYPEDHFDPSTFQLKTENVFGVVAGVFMNWRLLEIQNLKSSLSLQPEALYSMQGSKFFYEDNQGFNFQMAFNYSYVSLGLLFKGDIEVGHMGRGREERPNILSLQAGPKIGFNIDPQNIEYTSNSSSEPGFANRFGNDADVVQAYRNILKGRADFSVGVGLAFQLAFGLGIDAMYYFGLSDVIETQVNNYDIIDNSNKSSSIQLCLTYAIDLNRRK